jgi:hypothetical protein
MHWSALTLLFAATVLGAPAPISAEVELSITPEQRFQGDDFYLAVFDDAGVANVTFTPKADLLARSTAPVSENLAARALSKRNTVCAGRSTHVGDLDWANVQLANNGNNQWYNKGAWGWVRRLARACFRRSAARRVSGETLSPPRAGGLDTEQTTACLNETPRRCFHACG